MRLAIVGDLPGRAPNARGAYDVASLAAALTRRGHDVRVLTGSRIDSGVADGGYRVVALPVDADGDGSAENLMPMIGEMGRFLIDDWTADPPDAVHCHGWAWHGRSAGGQAPTGAHRAGLPSVGDATAAAGGAPSMHGTAVKLETLLARNATMVTTACGDAMHEVIRMGCPGRR